MNRMGKYLSLCLIVLLALSSLQALKSTYAQSTQKPTTPEFTLTFIPDSENVTNIDSFTGAKTYTIVDKSAIEVKIKNQPFTENLNGVNYYLYYNIYVTGHFDPSNQNDWRYYYNFPYNYTTTPSQNALEATNDEYTTVSIGGDYASYAQIDINVGAMLMHDGQFTAYNHIGDLTGHLVSGVVQGEISYSKQTFTIPDHLTSPATSPTLTPAVTTISPSSSLPTSSTQNDGSITIPVITFGTIIVIFVLIIIILLLIFYRKPRSPVAISKSL